MAEANVVLDQKPKLRPGVDVQSLGKPVHEIEVGENNSGAVSGLAVSNHSLVAILDENKKTVHIYSTEDRSIVGQFIIEDDNFSYANQMTFDHHNNIIIAPGDCSRLLRYNINGKKLPSLPPHCGDCNSGVACSPAGDLYHSVGEGKQRISRLDRDSDQWVVIYQGKNDDEDDEDEDEDDENGDYSQDRFTPGQLTFGPDGYLYVATENCVVVMNPKDGSVIRQIGIQQHKDGEFGKIEGLFVSGDGLIFICDQEPNVLVLSANDGTLVCNLFSHNGVSMQQPWSVNIDWAGYLYITDLSSGVVSVF